MATCRTTARMKNIHVCNENCRSMKIIMITIRRSTVSEPTFHRVSDFTFNFYFRCFFISGLLDDLICKYTRFNSTHFLIFPYFQLITGILPMSDYSGIHVDVPGYIPSPSVPSSPELHSVSRTDKNSVFRSGMSG